MSSKTLQMLLEKGPVRNGKSLQKGKSLRKGKPLQKGKPILEKGFQKSRPLGKALQYL